MREGWEAVIGMEVHAQLATRSKMFCASCSDIPYFTPSNRARLDEHSAGAMM